ELKTPVGAMSLLAEAIEDAADDPEAVRHFAKRLSIESVRLSALVQDVISLSRLQGRDIVETAEPLDITRLVSDAIDRVRTEASSRDIAIHSRQPEPLSVYGDYDQLMTAIRNLIDNAVTYSPDGSNVWVEVTKHEDVVHIAVRDQGPGIADEERERIFERFYRVDSAHSRATGGTGLGLSIVKHTVSNHGGEILVDSAVGEGSTFLIRLPELDPQAHEATTEGTEPDMHTVDNESQNTVEEGNHRWLGFLSLKMNRQSLIRWHICYNEKGTGLPLLTMGSKLSKNSNVTAPIWCYWI